MEGGFYRSQVWFSCFSDASWTRVGKATGAGPCSSIGDQILETSLDKYISNSSHVEVLSKMIKNVSQYYPSSDVALPRVTI